MTSALHRAAIIAAFLCAAMPAAADTVRVEATGQAEARDPAARANALDTAFAEAVSRALSDLLPAATRQRHQAALLDQVIRRARLYIDSYKVVEERAQGPLLRVRIAAQVDVDGLRDRLAELGIDSGAGAGAGSARPRAAAGRPRAALLLHAMMDGETFTTFGHPAGDGGLPGRALAHRLGEQGFTLTSTAGLRAPAAHQPARGLPLDDQAAALLAQDTGADAAFVVGVELSGARGIRGTALYGAAGRATVRVLDVAGTEPQLVAAAEVSGGGFAGAPDAALAAAAETLAGRITAGVAEATAAYWPPSVPADGALLLAVEGFTGWQNVAALIDYLSRTHGIRRVWPRRVGAGGVLLAVDTDLSRNRVASALRLAVLPSAQLVLGKADEGGLRAVLQEQPAAGVTTP